MKKETSPHNHVVARSEAPHRGAKRRHSHQHEQPVRVQVSNLNAGTATGLPRRPQAGAPRNDITVPTGLPSDYKSDERILAPIPGLVTDVFVKAGDRVGPGDRLLVIEAMKMKNTLRSRHALQVAAVNVKAGEAVKAGQLLVKFEAG